MRSQLLLLATFLVFPACDVGSTGPADPVQTLLDQGMPEEQAALLRERLAEGITLNSASFAVSTCIELDSAVPRDNTFSETFVQNFAGDPSWAGFYVLDRVTGEIVVEDGIPVGAGYPASHDFYEANFGVPTYALGSGRYRYDVHVWDPCANLWVSTAISFNVD